jgi:two-component system chemotaxis response regulator CheY
MPRVLVVDDSATMRKILVKGLRDAGFGSCQITEAGDGASALGALRGSEFDLVLCDINMPGMDGLSLVRSARADPTISSELPIVMITTEGGLEVEEALASVPTICANLLGDSCEIASCSRIAPAGVMASGAPDPPRVASARVALRSTRR